MKIQKIYGLTGRSDVVCLFFGYAQAPKWKFTAEATMGRAASRERDIFLLDLRRRSR